MVLQREDIIRALDKRLDSEGWPPDGRVIARTVKVEPDGHQMVGRIGEEWGGWPWLEIRYPDQGATLLFCGFALLDHWDTSPAPRYLVARMLETLSEENLPAH